MKTWRLWLLATSIIFAYSALGFNIYYLQIKNGEYYSAKAASQTRGRDFLASLRGKIFFQDKNSNKIPVAINKEYPVIYAVPKVIDDIDEASQLLAPIVKISPDKLKTLLAKPNDEYELLLHKADPEQVRQIRELGLKGIYIDNQTFRFYPFATLASQVLGFVSPSEESDELKGRYGIEAHYNDFLRKDDLELTIDR